MEVIPKVGLQHCQTPKMLILGGLLDSLLYSKLHNLLPPGHPETLACYGTEFGKPWVHRLEAIRALGLCQRFTMIYTRSSTPGWVSSMANFFSHPDFVGFANQKKVLSTELLLNIRLLAHTIIDGRWLN